MTVLVAGWVYALPFAAMALVCPLMMLGMVGMMIPGVRRIFGRAGANGHAGHGMMMCHGMSHGEESHEEEAAAAADGDLLEQMRAQRDTLDRLIARAESETATPASTNGGR